MPGLFFAWCFVRSACCVERRQEGKITRLPLSPIVPAMRRTNVDILPALRRGDSSCETVMSYRENVPGCIDISIMQRPTVGTRPFSYSKSCSTFRTAGGD